VEDLAVQNHRNLRRLVLSLQASLQRLNLLLAICDNWRYRDELIASYEAELTTAGVQCHRLRLDRRHPSLRDSLQALVLENPALADGASPAIVTVLGVDELLGIRLSEAKSAQEEFFFSVQWTREGLRQFQFPLIIWLTPTIAANLAQQAPDFWSWRGGTFEFSRSIAQDVAAKLAARDRELEPAEKEKSLAEADPAEIEAEIAALEAQDPDSPLLGSLYSSLGDAYEAVISYPDAETAYRQALAHLEEEKGAESVEVASGLNNLAGLYYAQGRYSEAEPLYQQALVLDQKLLGGEHPNVATSFNNLAMLYKAQGRYSEAEPLYQQALALLQKLLGDEHPAVANSFNNLAELYRAQGRYSEAEPLYQQALALLQKLLGDEHPYVATSFNNLGVLRAYQGRYTEAAEYLEQAMELRRRLLGSEHPDTQSTRRSLKNVQQQLAQEETGKDATITQQKGDANRHPLDSLF
jgi:tetratricopeptide (TPR) repeat protein